MRVGGEGEAVRRETQAPPQTPTPPLTLPAAAATGLWLQRREEQGYPLGVVAPPAAPAAPELAPGAGPGAGAAPFVLEIGSEELPPDDVDSAVQQLQ